LRLELVEVGLHDVDSATAKLDGYTVCVADAAKLVGKKVKARIERVLDGTAYATLLQPAAGRAADSPITAEAEAEKPTRAPRRKAAADEAKPKAKTQKAAAKPPVRVSGPGEGVPGEPGGSRATDEVSAEEPPEEPVAEQKPKRKTRRGSRGGRGRKKKTSAAASNGAEAEAEAAPVATIHVPAADLGDKEASVDGEAVAEDGAQPAKKKRTRRGSRGGRNRRKKTSAAKADSAEPS
jgi:ribonuclease E